jgi:hypothetical protein
MSGIQHAVRAAAGVSPHPFDSPHVSASLPAPKPVAHPPSASGPTGAYGYCRLAIIDAHPVKHMDTRTFDASADLNFAELAANVEPFRRMCANFYGQSKRLDGDADKGPYGSDTSKAPWVTRVFCRWWALRNLPLTVFDSIRELSPDDKWNVTTCPDAVDMRGVRSVPWWYVR